MTFASDLAAIAAGPLGVDATYTAPGGSAVSLRVVPRGGEVLRDDAGAWMIDGGALFSVPAAGLARPRQGATLVIGGVTFVVMDGATLDARGLVWTVEARRT